MRRGLTPPYCRPPTFVGAGLAPPAAAAPLTLSLDEDVNKASYVLVPKLGPPND
jgi:hypothetical protein